MDLRHEEDYKDFAEITEEEAKGAVAVETAKLIVIMLKESLENFFKG